MLHRDVGVLDRVLIIRLVEVDKGQIRRRVRDERLVLLLIALQHLDRLVKLLAAHKVERLRDLDLGRERLLALGLEHVAHPVEAGDDVLLDDGRQQLGRDGDVAVALPLLLLELLLEAVLVEHIVELRL